MSPMIKSQIALLTAIEQQDVEKAEDYSFYIGRLWFRSRMTVPSLPVAICLVAAKTSWEVASHLASFVIQGAQDEAK